MERLWGTYLEQKLQAALHHGYIYQGGSSAKGIDFPGLGVDLKVTSHKQPQSILPIQIGPSEDLRARLLASRVRV